MDVVGAVASIMSCFCAQNCLHESIDQQCTHLRRPKRYINKLRTLMEELGARKVEVNTKVEQMWLVHGMPPKERVKLWLKNVDQIRSEVSSVINDNEQERRSYCCCSLNLFCSRIKLGNLIELKMKEAADLLQKGQFSDDSLVKALPRKGYTLPSTPLIEYETTMQSLTRIWGYLLDDRVAKVGVYGMGGVGKTTIMTVVHNRLLEYSRHFDLVLWVSAKESNIEKLQNDVARKIDLDLSTSEDETERASKLFEALIRRKRFAIIIDDLWEPFPLERVGIPMPSRHNGCKLVITTRLLSICRGMETDHDVEIEVLSVDEAWNLFKHKVGNEVLTSGDIQIIAKNVAKECGGLPLAVVTVGRALRNGAEVSEWENAYAELRVSTANIERMEESVFSRLRFSFTRLKDDNIRSCFLFCALYPEGHQIDSNELIEYWVFEGLLGAIERTSASKRKGKIVLNELKYACLLESTIQKGVECVKMHDLIRDMAIRIMSTGPHCIIKAGSKLTKVPWTDEWAEDVQRVSLMRNDLKCLPFNFTPRCPILTSLLLQYNSFSENISCDFFDNMQGLKVLDLSYTGICALPESLSNLVNLNALLLSNCWNLTAVPCLAKLNKLMVFDLSCSLRVNELPLGMEELGNLRRLNISNTGVEILPFGLVSTLLEEMLTCNSGVLWGLRSICAGASIDEVISSSRLSCLEVVFWDLEIYEKYVRSSHWVQLDKFKFIVGHLQEHFSEKRCVAFCGKFLLNGSTVTIPENTVEIQLVDCNDIVRPSMCLLNVALLKKCTIIECNNMNCIVDSEENTFSMLEMMVLNDLINLKRICTGEVSPRSFIRLRTIYVEFCPKLKNLFSGTLLLNLGNLEEITVRDCSNMEYLMEGEEESNGPVAESNFPKLQRLRLENLPKLRNIYNGVVLCDSLRSIEVRDCNSFKRLPLALTLGAVDTRQQLLAPPTLEEIKGSKHWWESLEWNQPGAKYILQPYFVELPGEWDEQDVGSSSGAGFPDLIQEFIEDTVLDRD
ncbi:Disease resistance protein [Quillaja saponaria]|uniref:Disease resistance protein n=1 Tax=Quillaja saponaria TaxID=32244 RepID=A0AAD7M3R0_QUISA|nr:Disease resistance protein [Quillaja saponaria]KAJ7968477.1 Disease resistance protein [Quillaja saponaria]